MSLLAYVGCRTTRERGARGEGLSVFRVGETWERLQVLAGPANPSYLAFGFDKRVLYAVHGDGEQASAWRIGADGLLSSINVAPCGGRNPVHLAPTPDGRFIVIANHLSSSVALLRIAADGALGEIADLVTLEGLPGPHRAEQPFAKPHQVVFDPAGETLFVPDKGVDRVFAFRLDGEAGRLRALGFCAAREGAGPRHMAFLPDGRFAYVLNELDSTVLACRHEARALTPFQVLTTLPDDFCGLSRAAAIVVSRDGRTLFASNRGHDSVVVFAVDPVSGRLTHAQWVPSGGRTPRDIALSPDGRTLYAANEQGHSIHAFDLRDGMLRARGEAAATGSPVSVVFRPAPV
jgi:6-phosphogluconolactonase (cycloisomerase 2 family)